jgi:hypothetical protein
VADRLHLLQPGEAGSPQPVGPPDYPVEV